MGFGKQNNAFGYFSSTGTGLAIGTNIDIAGIVRGSDLAGTITVSVSAGALFTISASQVITFAAPIGIVGTATMTSSAGDHFVIIYRSR